MKKGNMVRSKIILTIILGVISFFLFWIILGMVQSRISMTEIEKEMKAESAKILQNYPEAERNSAALKRVATRSNNQVMETLCYLAENDPKFSISDEYLAGINESLLFQNIMIIDQNGNVKASAVESDRAIDPDMLPILCDTFQYDMMIEVRFRDKSDDTHIADQEDDDKAITADTLTQDEAEASMSAARGVIFVSEEQAAQTGSVNVSEEQDDQSDSISVSEEQDDQSDSISVSEEQDDQSDSISASEEQDDQSDLISASTEAIIEEDCVIDETYGEDLLDQYMRDNYVLLSRKFDSEHAFVLKKPVVNDDYFALMLDPWSSILKHEVISERGFAFVWSAVDNQILYYPQMEYIGQDISILGMDLKKIKDGKYVWSTVNGTDMYLYPAYYAEQKAWVVCACPDESILKESGTLLLYMWLIFSFFAACLVYYLIMLLREREAVVVVDPDNADQPVRYHSKKKRVLVYTLFASIAIFMSSFYMQTLYRMSDWAKRSEQMIDAAVSELNTRDELLEKYPVYYGMLQEPNARLLARFFEDQPEKIKVKELNKLAEMLHVTELKVTEADGKVIALSSYSGVSSNVKSADDNNQTKDEDQTSASSSSSSAGSDQGVVQAAMADDDGKVTGYLYVTYPLYSLNEIIDSQSTANVLKRVQPGEGAFIFTVNSETGRFTYHPSADKIGKKAAEHGLKEEYLQDNLCSLIKINRTSYYILSGMRGSDIIFVAIKEKDLLSQRLPMAATAALTAGVLFLLIGLAVFVSKEVVRNVTPDQVDTQVQHKEKTPESRLFRVMFIFFVALGALVSLYSMLHSSGDTGSVLDYVLNGNWERGLNAFALTSSMVTVCEGGFLIFVIRKLAALMSDMLPVRPGTIIRMLTSLLSYAGVFLLAYICCVNFGMQPTALMASAGVVSVVLGIGANSLVGDIIAGVFLLMEGNVQIGDMIKVNGFQGYVQELGIRMTKIYDKLGKKVMIIPNKEIQNVVHLSMHPAAILLEYEISYEEDLERAENLIREETKKMTGQIPHMIGEAEYIGVSSLDKDGVILAIVARGPEVSRGSIRRAINRRIYVMCRKNGITIPFPQLTLHQAPENESVYTADKVPAEKSEYTVDQDQAPAEKSEYTVDQDKVPAQGDVQEKKQ